MASVVFISKGAGLRVVTRTASRTMIDNEVIVRAEEVVEFAPHGRVELDEERDADKIEHLRGLASFNREFFEIGAEPDALKPSVDEQFERILDLATHFDHDALRELIQEEKQTHNRDVVIRAGEAALQRVRQALETAAEQPSAEEVDDESTDGAEEAGGALSEALAAE